MEKWNGFDKYDFEFEGRHAIIVFPEKSDAQKNWALKTEYWDAFPAEEIELLKNGFHLAFLKNKTRFATKEDCDAKARFAKYLSDTYGLRDKCVPVGMSCGGAHAVNFAGYYPEAVLCMYIEAPVLNFSSFPGREGYESTWDKEFTVAYPGVTRADLLNFEPHPINRVDVLKENKIPIILAYGTVDSVVPFEDNGKLMLDLYTDTPELLTIIPRIGQDHHPHGFPNDPQKIVAYILKYVS